MRISLKLPLILGLPFLLLGCEGGEPFDQSLQNLSREIERAAPGLQQKADEILNQAIGRVEEHVDLKQIKDELMESTTFDSMKGFYNDYSPFRKTTGSETLDDIIDKTKALQKHRFDAGADVNRMSEDVLAISLREKLAEYGMPPEQVDDFIAYLREIPTVP